MEELSSVAQNTKRELWYEWFPKYMCDNALEVLTNDDSLVATILSDSFIAKVYSVWTSCDCSVTENWKPESLRHSLLSLLKARLHPNDSPILFYILFVIVANLQSLRDSFFYAGNH